MALTVKQIEAAKHGNHKERVDFHPELTRVFHREVTHL